MVEFDRESKKIVLSAVEFLREKDQAIIDDYNAAHPVPNAIKYAQSTPEAVNLEAIAEEIDSLFEEVSAPSKPKPVVDIAPPLNEDSSNIENIAE